MKQIAVYDIETFPNYFEVGFEFEDGTIKQFGAYDKDATLKKKHIKKIRKIARDYTLVGFNNESYDDPMLALMCEGVNTQIMYKASKHLIEDEVRKWQAHKELNVKPLVVDGIDLIEVAPQSASLKLYGTRIFCKKVQDLPYAPHEKLNKKQAKKVSKYNVNDLDVTTNLFKTLVPQLELREKMSQEYGINLMSKSDPQIAEAILKHELEKVGVKVRRGKAFPIKYVAPEAVKFKRDDLTELVERIEAETIKLTAGGSPILPKWLAETLPTIGDTTYKIGIGGLHSQEKSMVVIPAEDETLGNVDVASYYPSLIMELGLYPTQLTKEFLNIYGKIKTTRLKAKAEGNKVVADSLKIVLNGSYGKYGSSYSFLYSPELMLQVTITGQLYLLMLIEALENKGFKVVSSNTDGVEILYKTKDQKKLEKIVSKWEKNTGMVMEYGKYKALYARDVNNYIAVYDGYAKAKGVYCDPMAPENVLQKNIEYPIVFKAIREYLVSGKPMSETIRECGDIAQFCTARTVKGGGIFNRDEFPNTDEYEKYIHEMKHDGRKQNKALEKRNDEYHKSLVLDSDNNEYLGKVVRWYYSTKGKVIFYKSSGNKVPKSDGAMPMMELADKLPKDLDWNKYDELCVEHLKDLGWENKDEK